MVWMFVKSLDGAAPPTVKRSRFTEVVPCFSPESASDQPEGPTYWPPVATEIFELYMRSPAGSTCRQNQKMVVKPERLSVSRASGVRLSRVPWAYTAAVVLIVRLLFRCRLST